MLFKTFLYFLSSYMLTCIGTALFISVASKSGKLMDTPNSRSAHTIKTLRGGGVIFVSVWFLVLSITYFAEGIAFFPMVALASCYLIGLVGFIDDLISLSAKQRLICQLFVSVILVKACMNADTTLFPMHKDMLGITLVSFFFVFLTTWSINLFNFMDGADGFAALQACFILLVASFICYINGRYEALIQLMPLLATLFAFLLFNKPRAKIFMGDVGSYFLGAIMILIPLYFYFTKLASLHWWIILYSPFWVDATITLLHRMALKHPWNRPHRGHIYQRLSALKISDTRILGLYFVINILLSFAAILTIYYPSASAFITIAIITFFCCIYLVINRKAPIKLIMI